MGAIIADSGREETRRKKENATREVTFTPFAGNHRLEIENKTK